MEPAAEKPARNVAIDAYRGMAMFLMAAEMVSLVSVWRAWPQNLFLMFLAFNQTHVQWAGMSLHDTIQPSFTFLVGVALPYSVASRRRKGASARGMIGHTLVRSLILVFLGVLLRALGRDGLYIGFEDTLAQIGLGYTFAFLLAGRRPRTQWIAFVSILFFYWLAWALYPVAPAGFDWYQVGVSDEWRGSLYTGFFAHWNKNANLGQAFDVWFLNLLPRSTPFRFNPGGYLTLNFIPTLGTMLLGAIAGRWLMESAPRIPFRRLLTAGCALLTVGLALHALRICPIVKRIWTPAFTLASGGVCLLFLAAWCWVAEVRGHRKLAFPFVVLGVNSIAAYLLFWLVEFGVRPRWDSLAEPWVLRVFPAGVETLALGLPMLAIWWLALYSMYRNRIFLRI